MLLGLAYLTVIRFASGRLMLFIYTHSEDESGNLFWADESASPSLNEVRQLGVDAAVYMLTAWV